MPPALAPSPSAASPRPLLAAHLRPLAIFSLACWLLCLGYFLTCEGVRDGSGYATGRDFVNYWTAGQLMAEGRLLDIFRPDTFLAAERRLVFPELPYHFWSYPPTALLLVWPLGLFGYLTGLAAWTLAGFAALFAAARALFTDRTAVWLLVLAPAMAVNVQAGQNGAFSAALLIGGLALLERRPELAGVLFGLLVFKPHLGLLLPVAVIAWRRWPALWSAAVTAGAVIALSALLFGVEAWRAFFEHTLPAQTGMMSEGTGPFLWWMTSAFAYGRRLGLGGEALWLQLPFLVFAAVLVWRGCRSDRTGREKAALVLLGTFVAPPQGFNYDLVPVAAAALLALERDPALAWPRYVWLLAVLMLPAGIVPFPLAPLLLGWALWSLFRETAPQHGAALSAPAAPGTA
jgi:hypothetical protein